MILNVKAADEQKSGKQNSGLTKLINVTHPQQIIKLKHWKKQIARKPACQQPEKFQ